MSLFENDDCGVTGQQNIRSMSEVYKNRLIDFAIYIKAKGSKPLNILLATIIVG